MEGFDERKEENGREVRMDDDIDDDDNGPSIFGGFDQSAD